MAYRVLLDILVCMAIDDKLAGDSEVTPPGDALATDELGWDRVRPDDGRERGTAKNLESDIAPVKDGHLAIRTKSSQMPRVMRDILFNDIVMRILAGQSVKEIALANGLTTGRIRQLMMEPALQELYVRERDKMKEDISKLITDEKAPSIMRKNAIVTRAQTLLAEVMDSVQKHIKSGQPIKSTMLKAGVDATVAAFNHLDPSKHGGGSGGGTQVNINLSADKAAFLQNIVGEAGVDLSAMFNTQEPDVIDVTPDEAP